MFDSAEYVPPADNPIAVHLPVCVASPATRSVTAFSRASRRHRQDQQCSAANSDASSHFYFFMQPAPAARGQHPSLN